MSTWYRFALVDCAAAAERAGTLHHHVSTAGLQHRCLFEGQPEAAHAHAAPWLIELPVSGIQQPVDHWLASLEQKVAGLTLLASRVPFEPLFVHLQQQLDIALPDGSLALMRFYDPRAWLRYCQVLSVPQQLELLGPVLEWQVTLQGQSHTLLSADLQQQQEAANAAADA